MRYEDDITFQRAILANPADTTLKLVYADWLHGPGPAHQNSLKRPAFQAFSTVLYFARSYRFPAARSRHRCARF
ncbi:MAG: TIGR02996 domain-containing protein [Planctomycetes bacterium]|nr:TIGR02996 domain-containing protein [Planctomycetota bacterium]